MSNAGVSSENIALYLLPLRVCSPLQLSQVYMSRKMHANNFLTFYLKRKEVRKKPKENKLKDVFVRVTKTRVLWCFGNKAGNKNEDGMTLHSV